MTLSLALLLFFPAESATPSLWQTTKREIGGGEDSRPSLEAPGAVVKQEVTELEEPSGELTYPAIVSLHLSLFWSEAMYGGMPTLDVAEVAAGFIEPVRSVLLWLFLVP